MIREMRPGDLSSAMKLKDAENWNQTEADWRHLVARNPSLCLVAEVDGVVVGTVTAVNYGNELAWIGMMLVAQRMRGRGLSRSLLDRLIERLGSCRAIKLDATPEGRPIYERMGFVVESEILRMESVIPRLSSAGGGDRWQIARVGESDLVEIAKLDAEIQGADRSALIRFCFEVAPERCWLARDEKGRVCGFVLGRPGSRSDYVGPLQAEKAGIASELVARVFQSAEGRSVIIDALADQDRFVEQLLGAGFSKERVLYRMHFRNDHRTGDRGRQFAIAGPEFG